MTAYKPDLAHIHDTGFGNFAAVAALFLLKTLKQKDITRGRVVDLGCGSGILARTLDRAGYQVLGIDLSPAMIDIARHQLPGGEFRIGPYQDVELPRACVAVTAIGEVFNYLFDPRAGEGTPGLLPLFRRVYEALAVGGIFMFDLAGPGRGKGGGPRHLTGPDWDVLVDVTEDTGKRRLTRKITTFRKIGDLYRRDYEEHRLCLHPPGEILSALRATGFRVRSLTGYGPQAFPPGYRGFLAQKPQKPGN